MSSNPLILDVACLATSVSKSEGSTPLPACHSEEAPSFAATRWTAQCDHSSPTAIYAWAVHPRPPPQHAARCSSVETGARALPARRGALLTIVHHLKRLKAVVLDANLDHGRARVLSRSLRHAESKGGTQWGLLAGQSSDCARCRGAGRERKFEPAKV